MKHFEHGVKESWAAFNIPCWIWIVAEFPMTESGKVAKRLLEQQLSDLAASRDGWVWSRPPT